MKCHTAYDANQTSSLLSFWHFDSRRNEEEKKHLFLAEIGVSYRCRFIISLLTLQKNILATLRRCGCRRGPPGWYWRAITTSGDQGRWRPCTTLNSQLLRCKDLWEELSDGAGWILQEGSCFSFFFLRRGSREVKVEVIFFCVSIFCSVRSLHLWFFQGLCVCVVLFLLCVVDTFMQGRLFAFLFCTSSPLL